jgi:hypothetical protein
MILSQYCKAYPATAFTAFPGWVQSPGAEPSDYLFLHDTFVVTRGIYLDSDIAFDGVTQSWIDFCRDNLGFSTPPGLERESAEQKAQSSG